MSHADWISRAAIIGCCMLLLFAARAEAWESFSLTNATNHNLILNEDGTFGGTRQQ